MTTKCLSQMNDKPPTLAQIHCKQLRDFLIYFS